MSWGSGTRWAGPEDWETHRDKIKELYWDQDLPLAEVLEIMQREHGFFATQKMYKGRFKTWELSKKREGRGIGKNRRPASQRPGANGKSIVHITHDGLVGPIKVHRSSKRAQLLGQAKTPPSGTGDQIYLPGMPAYIWRAKCSSRPPSPSSSNVMAPDGLRLPEDGVRAILDYVTSRFETGMWKFSDEEVETEEVGVCEWSNNMLVATETIQRGNTNAGFRMLQICLQQYRSLVLSGHPLLFQKSLDTMFYLLQVGSDLAASFVRYAASLCSISLGDRHPLTRLFGLLRVIDLPRIRQYARVFLQAQCDVFLGRFGTRNKYLAVVRLEVARSFHKAGVIPLGEATALIERIRDEMALDIPYWSMNYVLWAHIELAYTHGDNDNFVEADRVLQYVGDCLQTPPDDVDLWTKSHYYMLKARAMENLGFRDEATKMHKARVEVCVEEVGPEHRHTARALGDFERHYRKGGDIEAAERLRLDFEAKWDRVCEQEASPLDKTS